MLLEANNIRQRMSKVRDIQELCPIFVAFL
jgi:hypothetical protein